MFTTLWCIQLSQLVSWHFVPLQFAAPHEVPHLDGVLWHRHKPRFAAMLPQQLLQLISEAKRVAI